MLPNKKAAQTIGKQTVHISRTALLDWLVMFPLTNYKAPAL